MATPKPWVPYMNTKDCSQGFCSLYCPQWCYIIFPPPPPYEFPDDSSGPNFSPIVIAIIGILASAFLLVSYYAIISKYCKNRDSSRSENNFPTVESEENQDPSNHEPWHVSGNGLDEAVIKSISVFKYRKGDGLIEGTDCSVCLSEFQDDESLRLLPKCSHAFHVKCIDTWLKSHSNCPLCRSDIVFVNALPPELPPMMESPQCNESSLHGDPENENVASEEDLEMGIREAESQNNIPKTASRQASDLGTSGDYSSMRGIRIDDGELTRRSISMDYINQGHLSVADVLRIDQDEEDQIMEESKFTDDVGRSRRRVVEMGRVSNRKSGLHCVSNPAIMKRSFSSGRFLLPKGARGRNIITPL